MIFITYILFASALATLIPSISAVPVPSGSHKADSLSSRTSFLQIDEYLNAHNVARVVHGAVPLLWSNTLASEAQEWADNCVFAHTDGVLSSTPYGENLAAATGNFSPQAAVQSFLADESDYDPANPTYSDFTQIVWKSTTQVGCAQAKCSGIFDPSYGKATFHVCLYNPPGNVVGEAFANVQA